MNAHTSAALVPADLDATAPTHATPAVIPDSVKTLFRAALSLHEAGRLDEAERGYREALAHAPAYADALHNLGVIFCQRGQPEDALEHLFAAMNAEPAKALCWGTFAQALEQAGRFVDAWMVTEEAMGCGLEEPALTAVRQRLEAIAADAERVEREVYGDQPPAASSIPPAAAAAPSVAPARSIADILEASRQLHGAPAIARAVPAARGATAPGTRSALPNAALDALPELLAAGDFAGLEAAARSAVQAAPRSAAALKALGIALVRLNRAAEAVDPLRRALGVAPRDADIHLQLATALVASGRAQDALASFRRAIALRARYAEAHALLGNALLDLGRAEEAVVELRRAAALDADCASVHRDLARALNTAGRHEEAMVPMRRAQVLEPAAAQHAA